MHSQLTAILSAHSLFGRLHESVRGSVARFFHELELAPGDLLFDLDDPAEDCYAILSGSVALEGERKGLRFRKQGDLFGELALIPGQRRRHRAVAGPEGARLGRLPRFAFQRLVEEDIASFDPLLKAFLELGFAATTYSDRSHQAGDPRVVAFLAARDGVGRTTLLHNLAALLANQSQSVAIVDLDPDGGDLALLGGVASERSWLDLVPEFGDNLLPPELVREALVPLDTGVHLLPGPRDPSLLRRTSILDLGRVLEQLSRSYAWVLVDAPSGSGPVVQEILRHADLGLVTGCYSPQGTHALSRTLKELAKAGHPPAKLPIVLNQYGFGDELPLRDQEVLARPPLMRIPFEAEVRLAATKTIPDVLARPEGELKERLSGLLEKIRALPRRRAELKIESSSQRRARGRALLALGRSKFLQGDRRKAEQYLVEAVPLLPQEAEPALLLGRISEERGALREAGDWFRTALETDPENLHALCRAAFVGKNPILAQRGIREAAETGRTFPRRADSFLCLGLAHLALDQVREAEAAFSKALGIHPGYAEALRRRAELLEAQGQDEAALEAFRRTLELNPPEPLLWAGLSRIYHSLGLVGPAHAALRELRKTIPDHPWVLKQGLSLERANKSLEFELASYQKAIEKGQPFPDVLLLRAGVHFRAGNLHQASRDARDALRAGASLPGAKLLLRRIRSIFPLLKPAGDVQAA